MRLSQRSASKGSSGKATVPSAPSKLEAEFDLLLRAHKLPKPTREYRIVPDRMFRWDFAWPDQKLAVDIEGGIWRRSGKGAHSGGTAITRDAEKANLAQLAGWTTLRFVESHLRDGSALRWTREALGL